MSLPRPSTSTHPAAASSLIDFFYVGPADVSYARGRASRFDPKNPDGHYALDLTQPWDRFIAETLQKMHGGAVGRQGKAGAAKNVKSFPVSLPMSKC